MKWLSYLDTVALVSGTQHIGYKAFMQQIILEGNSLRHHIPENSRIAIIGSNSPDWAKAFFSIWFAGSIVVPIDYMATPEEIAYIINDCTPAFIFCDRAAQEKLNQCAAMLKQPLPPVKALERLSSFTADDAPPAVTEMESPDTKTALIIYTSGTTGSPKGVMLSFGNLLANSEACTIQTKIFLPYDRILVALPLHHAYPLMITMVIPMSIGATAIFPDGMTGNAIMAAIRNNRCTFIIGVPKLLEILRNSILKKVQATSLGRLLLKISARCHCQWLSRLLFHKVQKAFGGKVRFVTSGGAAASPQLIQDFSSLGFQVLEGYGMTETSPMISFTPPGRPKAGSPGKPIPCNTIRIEDGEVLVKGSNIMQGYYKRPEETAQVLDKDGWLHTGDLGFLDKDGYLFLTGRSKELIILGNGKNINPAELEMKLLRHGQGLFTECAISDDGHHLVALIVPIPDAFPNQDPVAIRKTLMEQVIAPFNASVASYDRITKLIVKNQPLPRTRLGKLRRHIIQQELLGSSAPAKDDNTKEDGASNSSKDDASHPLCQSHP